MSTIHNHLKDIFNNRIEEYEQSKSFAVITITNSIKPYSIKYEIIFQSVKFWIGIEYVNNKIEFVFSSDVIPSRNILLEIYTFVKFVEEINQDDLKAKLKFLS